MVKQLLQEATDGSNPSGDTSPSQGGWYCGITPANTGEGSAQKQPVPPTGMLQAPGRYREASPIEPQLPEKADDKPKTSAPLRGDKLLFLTKNSATAANPQFSEKALKYPKAHNGFPFFVL